MVGGLVSVQIGLLIKSFMAPWVSAREWLFSRVNAHVSLQVKIQRKLLAALITLVRFLTGMHKHMSLELGIVQEPLLAAIISALKQFVSMHCHMLLQRCSVVESFATRGQMTLKRLRHRITKLTP